MVVLAASITTSSGKPLLSRQFKDLTKDRVIELLSNFQNLVSSISSDHTFVEDEHVRYVYKPIDEFYIILITNRQSNIIQDLATLNIFSQTVNATISNFDEYEIYENAFEILSSFDEIICMGYKENLSYTQVSNFLAMESHEEKIQEIISRNKENEATEQRKRRAKEIARREQDRKNGIITEDYGMDQSRFSANNDPSVRKAFDSYYSHASAEASQAYSNQAAHDDTLNNYYANKGQPQRQPGQSQGLNVSSGGASMQKSHSKNFASAPKPAADKASYFGGAEPEATNNGILLSVNETVNAVFNRDGSIESSELKGVFEIRVNDTSLADATIKLVDSLKVDDRSYQFKTHPNIDKSLFLKEKRISLKDKAKSFPHNDQSLGVLRWRKVGSANDSQLVPLELSTWVSANSDSSSFDVTLEFEVNQDMGDMKVENLGFIVPVPTQSVKINEDSNEFGASIVDINDEVGIVIKLESPIEAGQQGSISFTIEADMEDALFPINTHFTIKDNSLSGVGVDSVVKTSDNAEAYPFDIVRTIATDEYSIV